MPNALSDRYGGFVVGWSDWLNNTLGLSFISVVFGEYAARLLCAKLEGRPNNFQCFDNSVSVADFELDRST